MSDTRPGAERDTATADEKSLALFRVEHQLVELRNRIGRELETEGEESRTLRFARMDEGCELYLTDVYAARRECASAGIPIGFYTPILDDAERMLGELAAFLSTPAPPDVDVEKLARDVDFVPELPPDYAVICDRNEKAWDRFNNLLTKVRHVRDNLLKLRAEVSVKLNSAIDPADEPKGGSGGYPARRKSGRPKKTEKDSATKVIAALSKWHYYENGKVSIYTPAKGRDLATEDYKLASNALSRFLKSRGGHHKYVLACRKGTIGRLLQLWRGELPDWHPELMPHESGREDDD